MTRRVTSTPLRTRSSLTFSPSCVKRLRRPLLWKSFSSEARRRCPWITSSRARWRSFPLSTRKPYAEGSRTSIYGAAPLSSFRRRVADSQEKASPNLPFRTCALSRCAPYWTYESGTAAQGEGGTSWRTSRTPRLT
jgi:hypothetical protein